MLQFTAPTTTAEYKTAFHTVSNTLETINSKSYNKILVNLINSKGNDIRALNSVYLANQSRQAQTDIDDLTADIDEVKKAIQRLSTSQADRDTLDILLTDLKADRDTARADRDTANESKNNSVVFSDLADSVQEYALCLLLPPRDKDIKKALAKVQTKTGTSRQYIQVFKGLVNTHTAQLNPYIMPQLNASRSAVVFMAYDKELRKDFIVNLARYYNAKSSVSRYIHSNKAPTLIDGTRTDYYTATAEQVNQWTARGHKIDSNYTVELVNGDKVSLMLKDGTLQFRKQHKTLKKGISIENYKTENGEYIIDGYFTSYHTLIDSIGSKERIERVFDIVNPTERERNIINYYFSVPAETTENTAHIEYYNEHRATAESRRALKDFAKACNVYATKERIKYAVKRETNLDKDNSVNKVWNRLVDHFNECIPDINAIIPKDTAQPTEFDYYNYLMQTNRGTSQAKAEPRADLVQWAEHSTAEPTAHSVISWKVSEQEYHTITAEEKRADEQTEKERQALRSIYSARLDTFKALQGAECWNTNGTYNANYSAFTFFNSLTESEQLKATELRLYEQSQAKAKAKQIKSFKSVTLEEWHKMSRAEKDKYIAEFHKFYR